MASRTVDPIRFEVIRNALVEITEEMGLALRRSAYSTNIKTRADYSCVLLDKDLRLTAQGFAQPVHLAALRQFVPTMVGAYGPEKLEPGDSLVSNHPFLGGTHLNDITFVSPVFYEDALAGYVACTAHHVDVGGGAPASIGAFREIYQEGVIIPPIKVVKSGTLVEDVFSLILAQIRSKHETAGDFRAQVAANNTGVRRFVALLDHFGPETVSEYMDELIDYTRRRTKAGIAELPQGSFEADGVMDSDGFSDDPVKLHVKVTISKDSVVFDLTGSDPQRRAPVSATYTQTLSAVVYPVKCLLDPDIPANEGFYGCIELIAPKGSVVNCTDPFPVVGGYETHMRVTEVAFKALSQALPDRVPAGTKGMQCHAGFGGIHPRTGEYYCFLETLGGGYGARMHSDGPDAVQTHGQNTQNAPVEETERNYPVRILRYELVEGSEGAGKYRGGLGLRRDWEFVDHEATFTILADREKNGPWGLGGGLPGQKAEYILNPDTEPRRLGSKVTLDLAPGDVISYRTCGGGGYGSPLERDPELVLEDVLHEKLSLDDAKSQYGVAVDLERRAVDHEATARLRSAQATAKGGE